MHELSEIVLASISPRRYELLTSLGFRVRVVPSYIDEGVWPGRGPLELALHYAQAKADAVFAREAQGVILAADTVVDLDGTALGKPRDRLEARAMLASLSGREHLVHSAFALIDGTSGRRLLRSNSTRVRFYPLTEREIDAYVASGDGLDKAGGYGIQALGAALVERIDGDFYTVMGLPLGQVVRALGDLGWVPPSSFVEAAT